MKPLRWYLRLLAMRLDPVLLVSALIVAGAALVYWGVTVPGAEALRARQEAHRAAQLHAAQSHQKLAGDGQVKAQLAGLLARFPLAHNDALAAAAVLVQAGAHERQLALDKASYQLGVAAGGAIVRYDISVPVRGSYPSLRAFLAQVRRELPHIALDSVSIGRPAKAGGVVEAQLRFSAYFRKTE
jgi:hypothetical protein